MGAIPRPSLPQLVPGTTFQCSADAGTVAATRARSPRALPGRPLATVLACAALLLPLVAAGQTTIDVTITADELDAAHGGTGAGSGMSLREAIVEANWNPDVTTTITLHSDEYGLSRSGRGEDQSLTGDLDVHGKVILAGEGTFRTSISAHKIDRVLHIHSTGSAELRDLTVKLGSSRCGEHGGGIYNAGVLTLARVHVYMNETDDCWTDANPGGSAGHGGGVYSVGSLTLQDGSVVSNSTGYGAAGTDGPGGSSGDGGGIYCGGGSFTLTGTEVHHNDTGWGNSGSDGANGDGYTDPTSGHDGGRGGDGGGVEIAAGCTARLDHAYVHDNTVGGGGHGGYGGDCTLQDWGCDGGDGGDGGRSGRGAGVGTFNAGAVEIVHSRIENNSGRALPGDGNTGGLGSTFGSRGTDGSRGSGSSGGGVYVGNTSASITDSTIAGNVLKYGASPDGAGVYQEGGELAISGSAIFHNECIAGGKGAGIRNNYGSLSLLNTTIAENKATFSSTGGIYSVGQDPVTINFCTVAGNEGMGLDGRFAGDNNIATDNASGQDTIDGEFNLVGVAGIGLGPLHDNGGPTLTRALLDGSPALDAGDPSLPDANPTPATDQRGHTRVSGGRADVGAYERGYPAKLVSAFIDHSPSDEGAQNSVRGRIDDARMRPVTLLVDWGDGGSDTYHYTPETDPFSFAESHAFGNNPAGEASWVRTLQVTLTDDDAAASESRSTSVTINNVAPALAVLTLGAASIAEGSQASLHGEIQDSVTTEPFTVAVDWGDGGSDVYSLTGGTTTFDVTHQYRDNGPGGAPYTITVDVADQDGAHAPTATRAVTVTNVAPTVSDLAVGPSPVDENATAILTVTLADPSPLDTFAIHVDWSDGGTTDQAAGAGATSFSLTHVYLDDQPTGAAQNPFPVQVTVTDDDGGAGSGSASAAVVNVAPQLTGMAASAAIEGHVTTLTGTIVEPSPRDTFTLQVTWPGGEVTSSSYPAGSTSIYEQRTVVDDDPTGTAADDMLVTATITDDDAGSSTSRTTVHVSNDPPSAGPTFDGSPSPFHEGETATLRGTIDQWSDSGAADTFTVEIDWADGSPHETLDVSATPPRPYVATHTYVDGPPGGATYYVAHVTITDDDGGVSNLGEAPLWVHNLPPTSYNSSNHAADEDGMLVGAAPGVLADDFDPGDDPIHVDVASSDTLSQQGARVTIHADGSFIYDPTARTCPLQGLLDGETAADSFTYRVVDDDGSYETLTEHLTVTGHDESGTIYVDTGASGNDDGTSWAHAFVELQDALAVAWGGNRIHVAQGQYTPDFDTANRTHTANRGAIFDLHRGVALYGGFPSGGASLTQRRPASYPTILSGDIGTPAFIDDNSYTVIRTEGQTNATTTTVLDGFTVRDANHGSATTGGMAIVNASPLLANCTFTLNTTGSGGGVRIDGDSGNPAATAPRFVNCTFTSNQVTSEGGAVYSVFASPTFSGCVFQQNSASRGGALFFANGAASLSNCTFNGNSATTTFGAGGGAIFNLNIDLEITNSVLWGDSALEATSAELHDEAGGRTTIRYSDVMGSGSGQFWTTDATPGPFVDGGGNLDANPLFTAAPVDLHLGGSSPAVDAASNAYVAADAADLDSDGDRGEPAPADRDGLPRFADLPLLADTGEGTAPIIDMGAFEARTDKVLTVVKAGTGDGTVTSNPPAGVIACGGTCMASLAPLTAVTLEAAPAAGSQFAGWLSSQPATCGDVTPPYDPCTLTMPALLGEGSVWAVALFALTSSVDLAITIDDGATNVVPPVAMTYVVTVTNKGPEDVANAVVDVTFPAQLSGVSWSCTGSAGAQCAAGGAMLLHDDEVDIPANGSVTYTATGDLGANEIGPLVAHGTVASPLETDAATLPDNEATDADTVGPEADLTISKSDGAVTALPGGTVTYTIEVANAGPADVTGAMVDDHPPAQLSGVSWTCSPSGGAACQPSGFTNITDYVNIPAGDRVTYTLTATLLATATGVLTNTARVEPPGGTTDPNLANNLAGDTDAISPACDLAVSIDDGANEAAPGTTVVYSIVASNPGSTDVNGARIQTVFPALLSCSWTGAGTAGTGFSAGPISGDLLDDVDIPAGGNVTYTATCDIALASFAAIANTATITAPEGMVDLLPGNNSDGDVDTLRDLDWGDAPNESGAVYPVVAAQDGARHGVVSGFHLGASVDAEADGLPHPQALGDDNNATADEDGVTFTSVLAACEQATVSVSASAAGLLDAFVDFNADGGWANQDEQVFASQVLVAGVNALTFTVPCSAAPSSPTFARFRFSSTGGLGPTGGAADGEVEDYAVEVYGTDFGDTADPPYPTHFAADGARHALSSALVLGAAIDTETAAHASANADGDAHDDGVVFTSTLVAGTPASLSVTVSEAARLDAWIDFDGDGAWTAPAEQVFADQGLPSGANDLSINVPPGAWLAGTTFGRFRVSAAGGLAQTGPAATGEVEDHRVSIGGVTDLGVTVSDGVAAATAGETATYTVVASNAGPSDQPSANVAVPFPETMTCTWTCAASPGSGCSAGGSGDIADTASLPVGGAATYTATCAIAPTARGTLDVTATIAPIGTTDPASGNDTATDSDTLAARGDLAVTKDDGVAAAVPGESVTYTITVTNSGPSQAIDVAIADSFTGFESIWWSCTPSAGSSCASGGTGALAEQVSIAAGGNAVIAARATIDPALLGTVTNTATVTPAADFTDTDGAANNTASDTDTLDPSADLWVAKEAVREALADTDLTYTLTVTNYGPSDARNVTLSDPLPAGTSFVSQSQSSGPAFTLANTATSINDSIAVLPSGAEAVFSVTVHVDAAVALGTLIENAATVASTTPDPDPTSNSDTATTTITGVLPPEVAAAYAPDSVPFMGGLSTLTVSLTNPPTNGEALTGVAFTATLPAGLAVATMANLVSTCSGTASGAAGSGTITLAGAGLGLGASCTVSADIAVDSTMAVVGSAVTTVSTTSTNGGESLPEDATLAITATTSFTGPTATGTGDATLSFAGGGTGCTFSSVAFVAYNAAPPCPGGREFPHGLVAFTVRGCTQGAALQMTFTAPQPLSLATEYWKYGPVPPRGSEEWYEVDAAAADANITFTIADGAQGDDDLTADGDVTDAGGPALTAQESEPIPAIGTTGMLVLAMLLVLAGAAVLRRPV